MRPETLIVVAAYDDSFTNNLDTLHGGDVVVMDTSAGGHPSKAFIDAYRRYYYSSYLFLQDSLRGHEEDVVQPFRKPGAPVVAWGLFPFFFDNSQQQAWVSRKFPPPWPKWGIFGPIFYATRKAMKTLEERDLFPDTPPNRLMAQGTERAWACAFHKAGIPVATLGPWSNEEMASGRYPVFTKTFAARP